MNERMNESAVI